MGFDFSVFVGRFHPLFVHLPIGMIFLTLILEVIGKTGKNTLSWMWFFSFLTALLSIFTGWQLTLDSSYPESTLFWHKWLGISVAATSFLMWAMTKYTDKRKNIFSSILKMGLVIILSLGGHLGGQLTHGDGYLVEAAPTFIKKLAGYKSTEKTDLSKMNPDSIIAYQHLVYPILEQKCIQCHNDRSENGNLNMTSHEKIMKGGDGGEVIVPGEAIESELFRRVTLEQNNIKFMPTKGTPMTYFEMQVLKWWLNSGAEFNQYADEIDMPGDVVAGIQKLYDVDFSPRPWYEKNPGPSLDTAVIESFADQGFSVTDLSSSDNYLEVGILGDQMTENLDFGSIADNILILNLKNAKIPSENYAKLSGLNNLIRLQLNGTNTDSDDLLQIKPLARLESINLFGTQIDDKALEHLSTFPSLKRIYTWQTNISDEGIAMLKNKRPEIELENGIN